MVWIDVRTPNEYENAHVVGAHNLPLFTNEERASVGTTYVQQSREAAIQEGLSYVGPRLHLMIRDVQELVGDPKTAPELMVYCARGGMRSQSVAWLFALYGYKVQTYPDGFQGYKKRLSPLVEEISRMVVIEGPTGSGKTELLYHLRDKGAQIIDLEGLGRHRGSAFGYLPEVKQPSGEMFTCLLIHELAKLDLAHPIFIESESQKIGGIQIPDTFFTRMKSAEVVTIHQPLEERVCRIHKEYGSLSPEFLTQAFTKISKRLGTEQANIAIRHIEEGDLMTPIRIALKYYDKAYERSGNELWEGNKNTVDVTNGDLQRTANQILKLFDLPVLF